MSLESVAGSTTLMSVPSVEGHSLWAKYSWPTVGQQPQAGHASFEGCDASIGGSTNYLRAPVLIPTPSHGKCLPALQLQHNTHPPQTVPFHHWGDNQSGPLPNTSNWVSADVFHFSTIPLTPSCDRTRTHQISQVLDLPKPARFYHSGSNRIRLSALVGAGIGT